MEAIVKPILSRIAIELPTDVVHLLRCGSLTVYDLLELLTNTDIKLVSNMQENTDAIQKFAEKLSAWTVDLGDDIEDWKNKTLQEIGEIIEGEEGSSRFVLKDGDVLWKHLSDEVKQKIQESSSSESGTTVDEVYFDMKGNITIVTSKGGVTSEINGDIPFIKDVYEAIPPVPPVKPGEESKEIDKSKYGGIMSAKEYEDLQAVYEKMHEAPSKASKTVAGVAMVGDGINVNDGVISTDLITLGITIDTKENVLTYNGVSYQLTPVSEVVKETEEWEAPVVKIISYKNPTLNNEGNKSAKPSVTFTQVKRTLRDGVLVNREEITYKDVADATYQFIFTPNEFGTAVNANVNASTGEMTANASIYPDKKTIGTVKCKVTYHEKVGSDTSASANITQDNATLTALWGNNMGAIDITSDNTTTKINFKKSSGVIVTNVSTTDGASFVTFGEIGDSSVSVFVQNNTGNTDRTATITVTSNIGTRTLTLTQAHGEAKSMMCVGYGNNVSDLQNLIDAASKTEMSGDSYTPSVTTYSAENANLAFVAISNDNKYTISSIQDSDHREWSSDKAKIVTVGDWKVGYVYDSFGLAGTTYFVVNKN